MEQMIQSVYCRCREAVNAYSYPDLSAFYMELCKTSCMLKVYLNSSVVSEEYDGGKAYVAVLEVVDAVKDNLSNVVQASCFLNAFELCLSFAAVKKDDNDFNYINFSNYVSSLSLPMGVVIKRKAMIRLWLLVVRYMEFLEGFNVGKLCDSFDTHRVINEFNQVFTLQNVRCWLSANSLVNEELFLRTLGCVSLGFEGLII